MARSNFIIFIIGIVGALWGLFFIFFLTFYIVSAIAYYTIAKKRGYQKPWLAWIPIANNYLKGAIADDIERRKGKITSWRIWLLVLSSVSEVLGCVVSAFWLIRGVDYLYGSGALNRFSFQKGFVIANEPLTFLMILTPFLILLMYAVLIALLVINYIVLYKTFQDYSPQNATVFLVLSIFVNITMPFLVLSIRDKPAVSIYGPQPDGRQPYGQWNPPTYGGPQPPYGSPYSQQPPLYDHPQEEPSSPQTAEQAPFEDVSGQNGPADKRD